MATPNKDTIYIDIDDEITSIIDKVRASDGKIVALVLPKRATVLQSIVNMKLLKRAADQQKKNLVLVTTEAGLMPLAGAVGLHVAKTAQSKPEIPAAPVQDTDSEEAIDEDGIEIGDAPVVPAAAADDVETIELDNSDNDAPKVAAPVAAAAAAAQAKKPKKNKKLMVPNFERFRLLLVLGVLGLIALIGGGVYALNVLPEAEIAIKTDATSLNVRSTLLLDTKARAVDAEEGIVPAKIVQQAKTTTQQAPATGQKNNGEQAKGKVSFQTADCSGDAPDNIPAGVGISSSAGTFITQEEAEFEPRLVNKKCAYRTGEVDVTAQRGGAQYNVSEGTSFSYGGINGTATSNFSGGTDVIVKIVSQSDIDAAKAKLAAPDTSVRSQLENQLEDQSLYPLSDTFAPGTPTVSASVEPGTVADTVTVTQIVTYTMFGADESDLNQVVDNSAGSQIDTSKQSILSRGLDEAEYVVSDNTGTSVQIALQTVVTAGPDLNVDELKQQVAGQKSGQVKDQLLSTPGVTDVQVKLSPFYVTSVPKKLEKVTITIAEPAVVDQTDDNAE